MSSTIDRSNASIQEPQLYDDAIPDEPVVDQTREYEGPAAGTVGAAIGGSAVGAIAGTLIAGPIGTALGATLGGVGGAMLARASEDFDPVDNEPAASLSSDDSPGPTTENKGPFENPAAYDETAADVAKKRPVLVGDDPGYDAAETT
jgi:hypothetical protein